jgi:hypothetical protein
LERTRREALRPLQSEMETHSSLAHGAEEVIARFEVDYLTFSLIVGKAVADANLFGYLRTSTRDRFELHFREQHPLRAHLISERLPFLSG